jgi:hypothetical protein
MFIAFGLTAGVGFFSNQILRTGDVRAIRITMRYAIPLTALGGIILSFEFAWTYYSRKVWLLANDPPELRA